MNSETDKELGLSIADTHAIKFFPTALHAPSKSVAVAADSHAYAHATPTHLLSPPAWTTNKVSAMRTKWTFILALISVTCWGQYPTMPQTPQPATFPRYDQMNYFNSGNRTMIPTQGYIGTMSNEERNRINMLMIERDMREYELNKQRQQQLLDEIDKGFGKTISYKFPSRLNERGAHHYKTAFDTLKNMLEGKKPLSIKKAVFATEWAYYESTLPFNDFNNAIKYSAQLIKWQMQQDKLPNTSLAKNYAIFKFFTDTLKVKLSGAEKRTVTHYPLRYDFEDFYGEKDWSKGMVSKLLQFQTGQCHSMPLLYMILAEELGSTAYLANSPEHTYIKIPVGNEKYQNLELTNGYMTTDSYITGNGYVKAEALANKVYMRPLSKKETVAQSVIDLAKGYGNKYGYDEFYLHMVNTALAHQPNNLNALYMKASYHHWLIQYVLEQDPYILSKPKENHPELYHLIDNLRFHENQLVSLGYEQMPKEAYADWLKSVEKEKAKSDNMIKTVRESIWQPKK